MTTSIPDIEQRTSEEIVQFQQQKLQELLVYAAAHSRFYQNHFKKNNISVPDIKTLDDLQQIPVTGKDALYHHNTDFICVDPEKIIDYVTTSGTLGDPLTF